MAQHTRTAASELAVGFADLVGKHLLLQGDVIEVDKYGTYPSLATGVLTQNTSKTILGGAPTFDVPVNVTYKIGPEFTGAYSNAWTLEYWTDDPVKSVVIISQNDGFDFVVIGNVSYIVVYMPYGDELVSAPFTVDGSFKHVRITFNQGSIAIAVDGVTGGTQTLLGSPLFSQNSTTELRLVGNNAIGTFGEVYFNSVFDESSLPVPTTPRTVPVHDSPAQFQISLGSGRSVYETVTLDDDSSFAFVLPPTLVQVDDALTTDPDPHFGSNLHVYGSPAASMVDNEGTYTLTHTGFTDAVSPNLWGPDAQYAAYENPNGFGTFTTNERFTGFDNPDKWTLEVITQGIPSVSVDDGSLVQDYFTMSSSGNQLVVKCYYTTTSYTTLVVYTNQVPLNDDYHQIRVTYDNLQVTLWVDGIARDTKTMPSPILTPTAQAKFTVNGSLRLGEVYFNDKRAIDTLPINAPHVHNPYHDTGVIVGKQVAESTLQVAESAELIRYKLGVVSDKLRANKKAGVPYYTNIPLKRLQTGTARTVNRLYLYDTIPPGTAVFFIPSLLNGNPSVTAPNYVEFNSLIGIISSSVPMPTGTASQGFYDSNYQPIPGASVEWDSSTTTGTTIEAFRSELAGLGGFYWDGDPIAHGWMVGFVNNTDTEIPYNYDPLILLHQEQRDYSPPEVAVNGVSLTRSTIYPPDEEPNHIYPEVSDGLGTLVEIDPSGGRQLALSLSTDSIPVPNVYYTNHAEQGLVVEGIDVVQGASNGVPYYDATRFELANDWTYERYDDTDARTDAVVRVESPYSIYDNFRLEGYTSGGTATYRAVTLDYTVPTNNITTFQYPEPATPPKHVAFVYTSGTISIYHDGVLLGQLSVDLSTVDKYLNLYVRLQ